MNSLAFKAFHYQVTVNINKRTELHKPLTAKLFIPAVSVSCFIPVIPCIWQTSSLAGFGRVSA